MLRTLYCSLSTMNNQLKISHLRVPYRKSNDIFDIINLKHKDPLLLFKSWFEEAIKCENVFEPNAMALATCNKQCIPSVRFVLLKELDENGFHFFTNYNSRKGQELDDNPYASLVFYWEPLKRQVRVEGVVSRASEVENEEYFQSRPKASQISATVSSQSEPIPCREFLDKKYVELENEYASKEKLPKPSNWGGYILSPKSIEFWQGQTNRLHDRIRFRRCDQIPEINESELVHVGENGWVYERLAP
ncbi:pyridoxamine 5'-phosphate oxidase [Schistosoma mansoni]|uniref:pyridoxal 5'-phosphate synthase n=1 Tax=Schistosoma mansoni TaxID=6183 RepID=G4M1K6_SCHMA|nr:pyridoxamine 5'-phosphate oxidase [Schistosoma mansoni]QPI70663.1 pyridoxamine/pyridoxine phosphate oxidase [Schistosoma mansoni]|eukprot:XP_018644680.1 pyridoxamine 5'-phosphate oxidase [Schistosoma mansoni]